MGAYTHRLTLIANHDTADLSNLPQLLGLPVEGSWKVGDLSVLPNGRVIGGHRKHSHCSMRIEPQESLPASLAFAVQHLEPRKDVLQRFSEEGARIHLFVGWFSADLNSSDRFEWSLLRDIAALKLSLDFDFYGPETLE